MNTLKSVTLGQSDLGGSCEGERGRGGWGRTGDRVISPVTVAAAALSLLFHVGHFAVRRYLAVASDDASAGKCGEPEKPNETHSALRVNVCHMRLSNLRAQAVLAQPRASIHNYRPLRERHVVNILKIFERAALPIQRIGYLNAT